MSNERQGDVQQERVPMVADYYLDDIRAFKKGETECVDHHVSPENFDAYLAFLNLESFKGSQVLAYHVENTYSGSQMASEDMAVSPDMPGNWKFQEIFDVLADSERFVHEQFVNDVRTTVALQYDEETVVLLGKELEECAVHCSDCAEKLRQHNDDFEEISVEYSCSHHEGEYEYIEKNWVGMVRANEFEDWPDWYIWTLGEKATDHREEQKEGVVDGKLELWQAEVGEVIHVEATHRDKPYVYDFTVVSGGTEPTVHLRQQDPAGEVIEDLNQLFTLRGSGRWTNRLNNPMVRGLDDQLAISYGRLTTGGEAVVMAKDSHDAHVLGGAISVIELRRPAEE